MNLSSVNTARHTSWNVSLSQLKKQTEQLTERGYEDSCQLSAVDQGIRQAPQGAQTLPVNLGDLKQALGEIEKSQDWLMDRPQISIYTDRAQETHIDVVNFGGFLLADGGHIASQSVNAW